MVWCRVISAAARAMCWARKLCGGSLNVIKANVVMTSALRTRRWVSAWRSSESRPETRAIHWDEVGSTVSTQRRISTVVTPTGISGTTNTAPKRCVNFDHILQVVFVGKSGLNDRSVTLSTVLTTIYWKLYCISQSFQLLSDSSHHVDIYTLCYRVHTNVTIIIVIIIVIIIIIIIIYLGSSVAVASVISN